MTDAEYFLRIAIDNLQRKISTAALVEFEKRLQGINTPENKLLFVRKCLAYVAGRNSPSKES